MPEDIQPEKQDTGRVRQAVAEQFAPVTSAGLPWRLMLSTLFLLLFAVFIYVGLKFGYNAYIDSQLATTQQGMDQLAAQVTESQQKELLSFYSQLVNLESALGDRQYSQNIFGFLEQHTLPLVYYSEAKYDAPTASISLTGIAATMEAFVEQTTILGQSPDVAGVTVKNVSISGNTVNFILEVDLNASFFKQIS